MLIGKKIISVLLLIPVLFAIPPLSGCEKKYIEKKKPVRIGLSVWAGYGPAFIAKEKGIFKKNNVDVELVLQRHITAAEDSYRYGETDGILNLFSTVILFNSEGTPTKAVYVVDYSDSGDVIIGKREFKSLKDLKGKKIGVERINDFSHYFILKLLEKAGIRESEVYLKIVPALDVLKELDKGTIDAGHTWEPMKSQALKKGYKVLAKAGDIPGLLTDVLAFNSRVIRERPEDIQNIVKSFSEAMEFVHANKKEAVEIMSKAMGMSEKEMEEGIDAIILPDLNANIKAMLQTGESTSLYSSYKSVADFYLSRGQISTMPKMEDVIDARFVTYLGKEGKNK